ncbi:helix-turn-helix domain-containing protein [Streptomyces alfalfae]|uniref:helix-turn-helix domain-containing protein n=1 Tax=Streptomyces alfalfae TaxID=1642299 RepID=UPI00281228E2|nr:helix-turn-helix transcriptional regulator [Streptomyces alfalfae]
MTSQLVHRESSSVGSLLREWRNRRGVSQLELASRAGCSARHLSFVETGRARPSMDVLLRFAADLDLPLRDRNVLLVAAGFAPYFPESSMDGPAPGVVRRRLRRLVAAHEPHPVLVFDSGYRIVEANGTFGALVGGVSPELLRPPVNFLRLLLHPRGLAPLMPDQGAWREHLIGRLRRHMTRTGSAPLKALFEEVSGYPVPPAERHGDRGSGAADGVFDFPYELPLRLVRDGRTLSFISTVMTFNAFADVAISELAVATLLPADAATSAGLRSLRTRPRGRSGAGGRPISGLSAADQDRWPGWSQEEALRRG